MIVWDLEEKDTAKAVQCLATSDDTASRLYQIQISKSIYSTHISFRHRYKLKKLPEEIKSNQYSFNWQNTTTDADAKVVYTIPKLLDGRRTK